MPRIQTTKIYTEIERAVAQGYTTISLQGSSRSSKTYNTLIWLVSYLLAHPGTRLSIVRAARTTIKGTIWIDFREVVAKFGQWNDDRYNATDFVYTFPNGSWVDFFGTDNEQKLRGRKRDVLFVNEANELDFIEWQQLQMRTTRFTIIDYNPSFSADHWINAVNAEPRTYHVVSTYRDNPFLEQRVIDEIESLRTKDPYLWAVYGEGKQATPEGLIFPTFDTFKTFPEDVDRVYIGMDFGYTNDPTAIVKVGIRGDDVYLSEECYRTRMTTAEIIGVLKEVCTRDGRRYKVIAESAEPREVDEIESAGVDVWKVHKYKGSIVAGINKMREYRWHIAKGSTDIQKEFRNYVWRKDRGGHSINEPIDAFNHAIDAVRYVFLEEVMGGGSGQYNIGYTH